MIKIVAIVGGGLALGAAVAIAIVLGLIPIPIGPAAEARAAAEKLKPPVTVMYITKERVVNLTDKAAVKYLKVALTLEFIDTKAQGSAQRRRRADSADRLRHRDEPVQRGHRRRAGEHPVEQSVNAICSIRTAKNSSRLS